MSLAGQSEVFNSYLSAERSKIKRGFASDFSIPLGMAKVATWERRMLTPRAYGNQQIWIDSDLESPTAKIFRTLNSSSVSDVAVNIDYLKKQHPIVNKWFDVKDTELAESIKRGHTEPVILIWPPRLIEGNIPDGNHRMIAAYLADLDIQAYIGYPSISRIIIGTIFEYLSAFKGKDSLLRSKSIERLRGISNSRIIR